MDVRRPERVASTSTPSAARFGGRYRVTTLLKRDRGVSTFLGNDLQTGRAVVLKTAESAAVSEATQSLLEHEAGVLRTVDSPCLASVLEIGRRAGEVYVVMPFLEGVTLAERLRRGRLSPDEAIAVGKGIMSGLSAAHRRGVLHRDVKPTNVIVADVDRLEAVTLIDFGLARTERLVGSLGETPVGSAYYLSPEQAGLLHRDIDERSDLYSAGTVLFECIAGRPPFVGDSVGAVLREHAAARPPLLRTMAEGVPAALDDLVQRLLRKDPRDRYQSAEAVDRDLGEIADARAQGVRDPPIVLGLHDRQRRTLTEPALIARVPELRQLERQLERIAAAGTGLALLESSSGGGKSRLLDEFERSTAAQDVWVLRGLGRDQGARQPLQVLDGVVAAVVERGRSDDAFTRRLRRRLANREDALLEAIPELSAVLAGSASSGSVGEEQHGEVRTIRALAELLDALGSRERPAVVMLDDCQWADELTVKLLAHWCRADRAADPSTRVLVVVAFRTEEVPGDHPLRELEAAGRVALDPLPEPAVRDLVESMAGAVPGDAVDLIIELSTGSPFMAIEVLRGLVESGALYAGDRGWQVVPALLADVQASSRSALMFGRRLEQAPANVLDLLSVGAVLGKQFSLGLATELARQTPAQVAAALADARERHIVWGDEGEDRCAFVHDKLREALLERLSENRRRQLHLLAASRLEARDASRDFELAYHFDAAAEYARALPYALRAAGTARSRYALEIAQIQFEIAARGAGTPALRREIAEGLGEVAMLRGQYDDASAHFGAARDLCDSNLLRARLEGKLGELAFKRGDVRSSRELLVRALRLLGQPVPTGTLQFTAMLVWEVLVQVAHSAAPRILLARRSLDGAERERLAMRLHSALAHAYWFGSGLVPCGWTHLRGMNLAERYPATPELAKAYSEHAPVMTMVPWCGRGIVYAEKSLTIRRRLGDRWGEGQSLNFYGVVLYAAGRYEEALERCGNAVEIFERTGDQWEVNTANWNIALALYRLGRTEAATATAMRVHRAGVALGDDQASGISLGAWAKASGGALPWEVIEAELTHPADDVHTRVEVLQAQALRLIFEDRIDEAVAVLTGAERYLRRSGLRQEYVAPVRPWLVTALRLQLERTSTLAPGQRRRRARRARRAARRARRLAWSYRNNLPHALRESGLLAAHAGRPRRARRLIERSLAVADAQGARHEYAETLVARALIDAALDRPGAAEELADGRGALGELDPAGGRGHAAARAGELPAVTLSLADRFATVLDAGRRIASGLTEPAVLAAVGEAAAILLRGERSIVIVLDESGRPRPCPGAGGAAADYSLGLIERACAAGAPVVLGDDDVDGLELTGARSALCVPIVVRGQPTACLYVSHDQLSGFFAEEEERLAAFIAALAGAALENAEGFFEVQALSASLEERVAERTAELSAAKQRVEEAQSVGGFGSWEWDLEADTMAWSEELSRIYRVGGRQRSFEGFLALVHPEDRARVQTSYRSHRPFSLDHRVVRADGAIRVVHSRGEVTSGADGHPTRMLGTAQDVTERRAAEEARGRLAALVDFSEDAIIAKTLDGTIESWNRGAEALFGYTAQEAVGQSISLLVPPGQREELAGIMAHIRRGERVEPLETVRIAKDGRAIDVSLRISLVYDGDGDLVGASSISRDITGQKQLEAQLRRSSRYFDLSRDLTVVCGFDGYFRSVNPAVEQILGWSAEEFLALPLADLVHPDDREATLHEFAKVAAGQVTFSVVTRFEAKDGSYRWLDWNAIVPFDERLMYASARDVTERKRAEAALAANERQTRQILETAHNAFIAVDDAGVVTDWNPRATATFGWSREEALGRHLSEMIVLPVDDRGPRRRLHELAAAGEGERGKLFELRAMHRDGREFPVELTISTVATPDGCSFYAFLRDVSERQRTQERLAIAHEKALEASQLKSEFVANMSHEIRTPLNGVIGMSGLLLDTELTEEQREYVDAVQASSETLMLLINDILDFSKIEAGKQVLDHDAFDLREMVETSVAMLGPAANEKGLELVAWVDPELPGTLYGDGPRLNQVLLNLLTNAVKFTAVGEVVLRVTEDGVAGRNSLVRFEVSDTGIGIGAASQERIFDSFSQADSSTTRRYGGTGLGLTISKRLINLMAGDIGVRSTPGRGSTFWFTVALEAALPAQPALTELAGMRVLVVDDNQTSRTILARQLEAWGMRCETAADADTGLQRLRDAAESRQPYRLVLIDAQMPRISGIELATAIRALPALRTVTVILLSASGDGRAEATEASIDGLAAKPVRPSRLAKEITRVMGGHPGTKAGDSPRMRPARASRGTVLVAEDNSVNQLVATRMLQARGFRVEVAANGREALEMHRGGQYDLILMDCQMPEIDGYQATAEIRRREGADRRTPIVAMTANAMKGDRERCLSAGMDDYVGKPVRPQLLDEVISRALRPVGASEPAGRGRDGEQQDQSADEGEPALEMLMDPSRLADVCGDDDQQRAEIVAVFRSRSRETIEELAAAIAGNEVAKATRVAHTLKGSSAVVGAARLAFTAAQLHEALTSGRTADAAGLLAELERTLEATDAVLRRETEGEIR